MQANPELVPHDRKDWQDINLMRYVHILTSDIEIIESDIFDQLREFLFGERKVKLRVEIYRKRFVLINEYMGQRHEYTIQQKTLIPALFGGKNPEIPICHSTKERNEEKML